MELKEYLKRSDRTVNSGHTNKEKITQAAMGIAGESGEIVDIIKKHIFQSHELDHNNLREEIGDLMWYLALLARETDNDFGGILQENINKLNGRYKDGFTVEESINREPKI